MMNSKTDATTMDDQNNCSGVLIIKNITASGDYAKTNRPSNVNDGKLNTWWSSRGTGSWVRLDVGPNKIICGVKIVGYKEDQRNYNFDISTSTGANAFTKVASYASSGGTTNPDKFIISPTKVRYLQVLVTSNIQIKGNLKKNFSSISEINVYGRNATGTSNGNSSDKGVPSISVRTGSWAYFPGDLIQISGLVVNSSGAPVIHNRVNIQVYPIENSTNPIYKTTALTSKNGTFQDTGLSIEEPEYTSMWTSLGGLGNLSSFKLDPSIVSKTYIVNVSTAVKGNTDSSLIPIHVRNAFLTPSNITLYLGAFWLLLFMLTVWWPLKSDIPVEQQSRQQRREEHFKMGKQFKAVAIFVFISGIVLTPIVSFLLIDLETGKNTPLGLVKKETIVNGSRNIQWTINIGGNSGNNFSSGIQIPIYILIFGIIGGYIRYLYDIYNVATRGIKVPEITEPKDKTTSKEKNLSIRGTADPLTTVIIFDGGEPILTTKADERGFWNANFPSLEKGTYLIRAKATNDTIHSSEFSAGVNLTIDERAVPVVIPKIATKQIQEIGESTNMKLFKESIQSLALIILSPLLALAIWLVLFQGGTTSDLTLAAIAITTGFLIPEIVTRLINFATPRVTSQAA